MGGFKKVIKRSSYKERSQPKWRKRLGLLEKRKDYSLRAKDFASKKTHLAVLREKAASRNEDEFYFGMLSGKGPSTPRSVLLRGGKKWTGKVDGDRGNKSLDIDTVRLLKTQDLGYVRTVRNVSSKEVQRLSERVTVAEAMLRGPKGDGDGDGAGEEEDISDFQDFQDSTSAVVTKPKRTNTTAVQQEQGKAAKIVFVDNADDRDKKAGEAAAAGRDNSEKEGEYHYHGEKEGELFPAELRQLQLQKLRRRLKAAEKRLRALAAVEHELELQKAGMAKTQSTGVVTKKDKLIKVNVRKR